jgi:hypothetical protein
MAGTQSTLITAHVTNACGTATENYEVFVKKEDCPPGGCEEPFKVYPNPASDVLNLTFSSADKESPATILLLNRNGKIIYTLKTKGEKLISIPVRNYKNGIYYLSVTQNGTTKMQQIIISH